MTDSMIASLCAMLSTMKADQRWRDEHDEAYLIGLEDLPDSIGPILRRELLRRWEWRPSVKELRDFAWKLQHSAQGLTPDRIVGEIHELIGRYGECGVRDQQISHFYTRGAPPFSCA